MTKPERKTLQKEVAADEGKCRIISCSEGVTKLQVSLGQLTPKLAFSCLSATGSREVGQSGWQLADTYLMT